MDAFAVRTTLRNQQGLKVGHAVGSGPQVIVGDRAILNSVIEATLPGADGQPRLEVRVDSSDGVPRVTRLELVAVDGGREVRATDLRAIKVEDLVEAIVSACMLPAERTDEGMVILDRDVEPRSNVARLRIARRNERRKVTDELLQRVAAVYRAEPDRPVLEVQRVLGVSRSTAFRYVQVARERGFLAEKDGEN